MTDLTGKKISNTYKELLKVKTSVDNTGIDSTVRFIEDGAGNNTALKLSNNKVASNGNVSVGGSLNVTGVIAAGELSVSNLNTTGTIGATRITVDSIEASVVSATTYYGDGSNLTGIVVSAAASVGTSATLETRIAGVSSSLQSSIDANASAIVVANSSIAANTSLIAALSATLETRIAEVSAIIPRQLTSLTNDLWKVTLTAPTTSGGKPEGYIWYVVS